MAGDTRALQQSSTLAPWAERVPDVGPVTVDWLLAHPDDGWQYEVVEGLLVRMAGSGELATTIAATIIIVLGSFVRTHGLGRITSSDGVYTFPGAETGLLPDVGFYGTALFHVIADRDKPIPFAPELAVEVASPAQDDDALATKARLYLRGGTRLVWVVWPHRQTVDVWRASATARPVRPLGAGDLLDGEDVVPGFSHPVDDLFA
jgi:Uma2 family endonuclease